MALHIIVAVDQQGGFAKAGKIPWHCPADLAHFRDTSKAIGNCVMGRRTYEDLLAMRGKTDEAIEKIKSDGILPDRTTYVVTSSTSADDFPGATIVPDLRGAIQACGDGDLAVCGGEQLYVQAYNTATNIHITVIPKTFSCDRFFPVQYIHQDFVMDKRSSEADEHTVDGEPITVAFIKYTRK